MSIIGRFKTVNEFLGDFVDAVKDTPWPKAISIALPWAGIVGEAIADCVAPIKFLVKIYENATRKDDPSELGLIACTVAFERSIEQALRRFPPEQAAHASVNDIAAKGFKESITSIKYTFDDFSYTDHKTHPFFRDARASLERCTVALGLDENRSRKILDVVDKRFVSNLRYLLSSGDTAKTFAPFRRLLDHENPNAAYEALARHVDYQRWLFEDRAVLGNPFALAHVYVDTDCGKLSWGEIEAATREMEQKFDPFQESLYTGGRHQLLDCVIDLMQDDQFHDAIVIQGHAGAGKSAFTLRLCTELIDRGLQPIRIELKHIDASRTRDIGDKLPTAVRLGDFEYAPNSGPYYFRDNLFRDNRIFDETTAFGKARISKYVLILDAWDEISVGAEIGYQQQVNDLLQRIRDTYLNSTLRGCDVRVIITGRPSIAISQAHFLRDATQVLTVRPLSPEQFEDLVRRVGCAIRVPPIQLGEWQQWSLASVSGLPQIFKTYREDFEQRKGAPGNAAASLDILGLPLLTLLALRLMADWKTDASQILENTTVLYRSLVDLVIGGGKPRKEAGETEGGPHLRNEALRKLLRGTSEAITAVGVESITRAELQLRLRKLKLNLDDAIQNIDDNILSRLMISFFFKGGHDKLGCEFSHKSFREYLFAEQVVEILKEFGNDKRSFDLRETKNYWREFEKNDPRFWLSRRLTSALGPKWITGEVGLHITRLIEWEVMRAHERDPYPQVGQPTTKLTSVQWERIRDGLADLWDWWGEGVPMRSQPMYDDNGSLNFTNPLFVTTAEDDRLLSRSVIEDERDLPRPTRVVTVDAHIGDALFQMCCDTHRAIANVHRGDGSCKSVRPIDWTSVKSVRRYQILVETQKLVLFSPAGHPFDYFRLYFNRIDSAGYRWRGTFPRQIDMSLTYLSGANLALLDLSQMKLSEACLKDADLSGTNLYSTDLAHTDLTGANLSGVLVRRGALATAVNPGQGAREIDGLIAR